MTATTEHAFAKINLALHVVGQREDGYHLLDSLVVFSKFGDEVTLKRASDRGVGEHRLTITGAFSKGLEADQDNLVLKALNSFDQPLPALDVTLLKNLPVASGIGGGSADAAATIRAACRMFELPLPHEDAILKLGADVPVCIAQETVRMAGIGEDLSPIAKIPNAALVLVNPGVGVSTPAIFKSLTQKNNPTMPAIPEGGFLNWSSFSDYLLETRNDLQPPAEKLTPEINEVISRLGTYDGAQITRMSGSGATCFAVCKTLDYAKELASSLNESHPDWWVVATEINV